MHFDEPYGIIVELRKTAKTKEKDPGVAKFGIALEWGSRGPEFESQHSDQKIEIRTVSSKLEMGSDFFFLQKIWI